MHLNKRSLLIAAIAAIVQAQEDSSCDPQNDDNNDATCTNITPASTASGYAATSYAGATTSTIMVGGSSVNTQVSDEQSMVPTTPTGIVSTATGSAIVVSTMAPFSTVTGSVVNTSASAGGPAATVTSSTCPSGYQCPITPTSEDAAALNYAYVIQNLLVMWYQQYDFTADEFSALPNAQMTKSNGQTFAANSATNFADLKQQAQLGLQALMELGQSVPGFQTMDCNYNYPPGLPNVTAALMSATLVEATLCGAFIGAADYVYAPQASFLMARIAAEHGIHGSYLQGFTMPVQLMSTSNSLTPAFTPEQILSSGMGVGYLGDYIPQSCVQPPSAPCGASISIVPLLPTTSAGSGMAAGTMPAATTIMSNGVPVATSTMYGGGYGSGMNNTMGGGAAGQTGAQTGPYASASSVAAYTGAAAAPTGFRGAAGALGAGLAALAML